MRAQFPSLEEYYLTDDKSHLLEDPITLYSDLLKLCWWCSKIDMAWTISAIKHSYCISLFHGETRVGFARCITDYCAYARLTDVYVLPEHRGKGLASWMTNWILSESEMKHVRKVELMAAAGHVKLYQDCGFEEWKDEKLTFMSFKK